MQAIRIRSATSVYQDLSPDTDVYGLADAPPFFLIVHVLRDAFTSFAFQLPLLSPPDEFKSKLWIVSFQIPMLNILLGVQQEGERNDRVKKNNGDMPCRQQCPPLVSEQ